MRFWPRRTSKRGWAPAGNTVATGLAVAEAGAGTGAGAGAGEGSRLPGPPPLGGLGVAAVALEGENAPVEFVRQADLLRDIFGNPFRPIALADAHRTPTIASLARAAYDERQLPSGELDLHRLAVLADALDEVGAPGELLEHLRSPGPHVRGCWALDLVLGLG